jgi:SAM-dependent methyltransferase
MRGGQDTEKETRQRVWDAYFDGYYRNVAPRTQSPEAAREEALAIKELDECREDSLVLDMPCGFGRHSGVLAEEGIHVVGADRSQPLLREAVRRRRDRWPLLVRGDYHAIPFADGTFDVALNLFTSFGLYDDPDNLGVLREFRRVLRPSGRLLIEIMNRDYLMRIFQPHDWHEVPEVGVVLSERAFDPMTGVLTVTETVISPSGKRTPHTYDLRVYTADELTAMVKAAGFDHVRSFGGYEGQPFTFDTRLTLLARAA